MLQLKVPTPCAKNWNEMLPAQQGRFCANCTTEVIDFRNFSNDELKEWFHKNNGTRICGNFNKSQLINFNQELPTASHWRLLSAKILMASCLTLFVNAKVDAENRVSHPLIVQKSNSSKKALTVEPQQKSADSLVTIRGIVKAKDDKAPLPGVWIGLANGKRNTVTDSEGRFSISVPAQKNIYLVFKYIGFEMLTQRVNDKKNNLQIFMDPDQHVLGEVVIIKAPLHKRFWNFVKRPFTTKN